MFSIKRLILATFASVCFAANAFASPIVMGYWTDWSPYWTTRPFPVSGSLSSAGQPISNPDFDAQVSHLTVMAYAFLETDTNGVVQFFDPWSDLSTADATFCTTNTEICRNQIPTSGLGNFAAFSKLNTIKRVISIGGYSHDDTFNNAFANPTNFANSVAAIVNGYQLDGVDFDFEPMSGWNATLANQYIQLIQAVRAKLPNAFITIAFTANQSQIANFDGTTHQWQTMSSLINAIGVMAYDFHGGFDGVGQPAAFQSNLYSDPSEPYSTHYSADAAIQAFKAAGVPSEQLVLGVPAYGRVVSSVPDNGKHGLYQPIGNTFSGGDLGGEMESYYSIVGTWLGKGYTDYWYNVGNNLSGVFAYNASSQNFVAFDNTALIDSKVAYVKQNQLGGMMMWELRADISPNDANNASLLKHMFDGLQK